MAETRIRLQESARAGEIVEARASIMHPMETGLRKDASGAVIPRNIIARFVCIYDGEEVFRARLDTGVSENPFFGFFFTATTTGPVLFRWIDQFGAVTEATRRLTVTG